VEIIKNEIRWSGWSRVKCGKWSAVNEVKWSENWWFNKCFCCICCRVCCVCCSWMCCVHASCSSVIYCCVSVLCCSLFVCNVCYLSVVLLYYCHRVKAQLQFNKYICLSVWFWKEPTFQRNVFLRSLRWLVVKSNVVSTSPILVILMMEALRSSETSVITKATQRNIP
jgi:hypothetical protein